MLVVEVAAGAEAGVVETVAGATVVLEEVVETAGEGVAFSGCFVAVVVDVVVAGGCEAAGALVIVEDDVATLPPFFVCTLDDVAAEVLATGAEDVAGLVTVVEGPFCCDVVVV